MGSWSIVVLPIILGTIGIALHNILKRYVVKDKTVSPLQFLVHSCGLATMLFGGVYLLTWDFAMPQVLPGFWRAVLLGTTANLFIFFFNTKAASIDAGEVSLTAPLQAMTPGLITGLAILLGEFPSKIGVGRDISDGV